MAPTQIKTANPTINFDTFRMSPYQVPVQSSYDDVVVFQENLLYEFSFSAHAWIDDVAPAFIVTIASIM